MCPINVKALESQNLELVAIVTELRKQDAFRKDENAKLKQHYLELSKSAKFSRDQAIENTKSLLNEI